MSPVPGNFLKNADYLSHFHPLIAFPLVNTLPPDSYPRTPRIEPKAGLDLVPANPMTPSTQPLGTLRAFITSGDSALCEAPACRVTVDHSFQSLIADLASQPPSLSIWEQGSAPGWSNLDWVFVLILFPLASPSHGFNSQLSTSDSHVGKAKPLCGDWEAPIPLHSCSLLQSGGTLSHFCCYYLAPWVQTCHRLLPAMPKQLLTVVSASILRTLS